MYYLVTLPKSIHAYQSRKIRDIWTQQINPPFLLAFGVVPIIYSKKIK